MHAITAEEVAGFGVGTALAEPDAVPRVGFVVSKAVGNSVVRHRVARRLRHQFRDRLGTVRPGCTLVVRALPSAARAASADLGSDLDSALRKLRLRSADRDGDAGGHTDTGGAK